MSLRTVISSCFFALATLGASAQDYFAQYGQNPLEMVNIAGGNQRTVFVTGLTDGQLAIRYNRDSAQEVFMPLDSESLKLNVVASNQVTQAINAIRGGSYEDAIEVLRPTIYPMIRFLEIPEDKTNLHRYVDTYLFALRQTGEHYNEAYDILDRMDLKSVPPSFLQHAIAFVEQLALKDESQKALALITRLPVDSEMSAVAPILMNVAGELRDQQKFEQALALYERVMSISDSDLRDIALLWNAYCNAALGREQTAEAFLGTSEVKDTSLPAFSLKMLVQGQMALQDDNFAEAMRHVSRGLVFADVSYDWTPELTYWSGFCYEQLGNPETARHIYEELSLLFPMSSWTVKGRDRLLLLPLIESEPDDPSGS